MTQRDVDVLEAIRSFTTDKNRPPTIRELGAAVQLSSPATVMKHLMRLRKAGKVTWTPGVKKTLLIVEVSA